MRNPPSGRAWVVTFHPLVSTKFGINAVKAHGLPPFIDGSCRREPDLLSRYPSISALCRAGFFAPKLKEGDDVVYVTVKREYGAHPSESHHRYVARLRIKKVFANHADAAAWYRSMGHEPPNNCLVPGNPLTPYDQTHGGDARVRKFDPRIRLKAWESAYSGRVGRYPVFVACEAMYLETHVPRIVDAADWAAALGGVPATETPKVRTLAAVLGLETLVTSRSAPLVFP